MKIKRAVLFFISLGLALTVAVNFAGCAGQVSATELTAGITANIVSGRNVDDKFTGVQMELYAELFREGVKNRESENVFISPLSLHIALAMAVNGAEGETKSEMEKLLGGDIPIDELNEYLYSYVNSLSQGDGYKIDTANSIWLYDKNERLQVENEFLQKCCDYYSAQVFKAPFDSSTVNDMNSWASEHTDGMIDKIVEKIDSETVMVLMNAVFFDAQWETPYESFDVITDSFVSVDGDVRTAKMMCSNESVYLTDGKAVGFMKNYKGGKYAFAALLPEKNVNIYDYVQTLTGEKLTEIFENSEKNTQINVRMPKFSCEYGMSFKDVLSNIGMETAFDSKEADFTNMAKFSDGNIFIGDVFHKTFISVDEAGTKAGAVTRVDMNGSAAPMDKKEVFLDRPFVYMIIDKSNNLPIFMGVLADISE